MTIEQIKNIELHFVVSTARTGSTLLSAMFNMHENLLSPVEEPFAFNLYFKYHSIKKWTKNTIQDFCYDFYLFSEGVLEPQFGTRKELKEMLEKYIDHLDYDTAVKITYLCFVPEKDKSHVKIIIDKQLRFHQYLEKVALFFPNSKFIILNRDPRDNAVVKMRRIKREKRLNTNYHRLANDWLNVYKLIYTKKEKIGSHRFIEIKYEDVVAQPEKELKRIANFLNFEYDVNMLQYHLKVKEKINNFKDDNDIKKELFLKLHQSLAQETNTDKVGFWKQNLTEQEANTIWYVCGELAEKIGYKKDGCEKIISKNRKYYYSQMRYFFYRVLVPEIYYSMPFFFRYIIKKIKYGNRFKQNVYTSDKFQETAK